MPVLTRTYAFWECPDCGWVGFSEDGHCRQFDEHPDGPRIPLRPITLVDAAEVERLKRLLDQRGKDAADAEDEVERLREALRLIATEADEAGMRNEHVNAGWAYGIATDALDKGRDA